MKFEPFIGSTSCDRHPWRAGWQAAGSAFRSLGCGRHTSEALASRWKSSDGGDVGAHDYLNLLGAAAVHVVLALQDGGVDVVAAVVLAQRDDVLPHAADIHLQGVDFARTDLRAEDFQAHHTVGLGLHQVVDGVSGRIPLEAY